MEIRIEKTTCPKMKPEAGALDFGTQFTDHMFVMNYEEEKGWYDPRIIPYGPIQMDPSQMILHYGQETFEGLKAYKSDDAKVLLFRPEMNARRMNRSNERMCIPKINEEDFVEAVKAVVSLDREWIPDGEGNALYIRPFIFATEASLKVHPSRGYTFMIILSPVGPYYNEGLNPVSIYIEREYVRAVIGGVGYAKTAGNYGASLIAHEKCESYQCSQVLWLDAKEHKHVEEVGTMNVFFVIDGQIVTPSLSGSILPGITRDSVIILCKSKGYDVIERVVDIEEIISGIKNGRVTEVFGTGTAAVISPVGELVDAHGRYVIGNKQIGDVAGMLYKELTGIQLGLIEDTHNFIDSIE